MKNKRFTKALISHWNYFYVSENVWFLTSAFHPSIDRVEAYDLFQYLIHREFSCIYKP